MDRASSVDHTEKRLRQTFLGIARRRAAPGTGSSALFLDRRIAMQPVPDLPSVLGELAWVLVDGLALRAFMPERQTLDVDILIAQVDEAQARQRFTRAGYRVVGVLSIGGFSVTLDAHSPPIDVLVADQPWLQAAIGRPARDAAGLPVLPRPELIVMKLLAARARDLGDVQGLLRTITPDEVRQVRDLLSRIDPDAIDDFEALRALADLEFGGPNRPGGEPDQSS